MAPTGFEADGRLSNKVLGDLTRYKFRITQADLILPEDAGVMSLIKSIVEIQVKGKVDGDEFFPVIGLGLRLNYELLLAFQKYTDDAKVVISIKRYRTIDSSDENSASEPPPPTDLWKQLEFRVIDFDRSPTEQPAQAVETEERRDIEWTATLLSSKHLDINKAIFNDVYTETPVLPVVLHMLKTASGDAPKLIGNPDNTKVYDQILVPPGNVISSLRYLQDAYGIYKGGMRLFFDLDRHYMLGADSKVKEKTEYGEVHIFVTDKVDASSELNGVFEDTKNKTFQVKVQNAVAINRGGRATKEIFGSKLFVLSDSQELGGQIREVAIQEGTSTDGAAGPGNFAAGEDKIKVLYNRFDNPMAETTHAHHVTEHNSEVAFSFSGVDPSIFTPNKSFFVIFSNKERSEELNGEYVMRDYALSLHGVGRNLQTEEMICTMTCTFSKR
jgi:hypothetical protein